MCNKGKFMLLKKGSILDSGGQNGCVVSKGTQMV